ncbi:MAG: heavy-metal-associated domain-containing protein [Lachnospiraceae bacterium]|nr:heavy-metal-associated domain-containing protein [Lachnospiraceae bacterium]
MVKMILSVDGMMCGMCEAHINDVVRRTFNVRSVTSSHKTGETVIITDEKLNESKLKAVIGETGYRVLNVRTEQYVKKSLFSFFKNK